MQVEVLQAVLKQQLAVAILQLLASRQIGEVDDRAVKPQRDRDQDVLAAPCRGHRLSRDILLRSVAVDVATLRSEVWSEIGQDLAQAGFWQLGTVEGAKAAADVVKAMTELVQLARGEAEWVAVVADAPETSPDVGRRAHA